MSRYLEFVLQQAGAPQPRRVAIVRHERDWVNRQIADEFFALFDGIDVKLTTVEALETTDLVVVPYMNHFLAERTDVRRLCRRLAGRREAWAMLYGLQQRTIHVMPAVDFPRFASRWNRAYLTYQVIDRLNLVRPTARLFRWLV